MVGDIFSLAACNETGHRRLMDMMDEFGLDDLVDVADFILDAQPRRRRSNLIAALPDRHRAITR